MARPRSRKQRWDHPLYNIGFCINRKGIVYTELNGNRLTTNLKWHLNNKETALAILEKRVLEYLNPVEEQKPEEKRSAFQLIKEFSKVHFPNVSITTQRKFKQSCAHFLKKDFLLDDFENIKNHIHDNIQKSKLHQNTKQKLLQALRQIFNYGIEEGYLVRNPVKKNIIPKPVKPEYVIFTLSEVNKLIEYFEKDGKKEFALFIKFLAVTAVRVNEAIQVHWSDIDEEKILIHGKGNRDRPFPINAFPEINPVLQDLEKFKEKNNGKLFRWNSYAKLEKWIRDSLKEMKIDNAGNFHAIRKMRENQLIQDEDLDLNIVAEILGHTKRVQEKHYLEVLGAKKLTEIILRRKNDRKGVLNMS